ncbi:hypothetical protein ACVMAJ_004265 [Bradyrhizobium sp. USDA 4448]
MAQPRCLRPDSATARTTNLMRRSRAAGISLKPSIATGRRTVTA